MPKVVTLGLDTRQRFHGRGGAMGNRYTQKSNGFFILIWCAIAAISQAAVIVAQPAPAAADAKPIVVSGTGPTPDIAVSPTVPSESGPAQILGLVDGPSGPFISGKDKSNNAIESHVGLNGKLWVVLNQPLPLSPEKYTLFMNGVEVKGLDAALDGTYQGESGAAMHALVFTLQRNKNNDAFWRDLLGSLAGTHVPVVIALGEQTADGKTTRPTIAGVPVAAASFEFEVIGLWRLLSALVAILGVVSLVWGHARTRTTLRDSYLPQIMPSQQTYSLARWQMAFWFTLIFAAFVCLFIVLWDTNTISTQALMLMGISGTTALAAVAVDAYKDSPADAANRGLQALGLKNYADVQRVQAEIASRKAELASLPSEAPADASSRHAKHTQSPVEQRRRQLQIEIQDRDNILRTYAAKIQPFVTQGWFKDITTDINGTAIHRLQAVCWTFALGAVFVITVYRTLAMPEFNVNLLTLMGISSASYVGFKFPEVNN
jgi:hypothetical protein